MKPTWATDDGSVKLYRGDCVEVMAALPEASIDSICCDPPYGLEFMGTDGDKLWDKRDGSEGNVGEGTDGRKQSSGYGSLLRTGVPGKYIGGMQAQSWHLQWATAALRVAKPGAFLLAFGGSRASHRLVCAIEDAGWEVRDGAIWLYATGFPKSLDISKQLDKAAGAEREVVGKSARHVSGKPSQRTDGLCGTSTFAETIGMGGTITAPATDAAKTWDGYGTALSPSHEPICVAMKPLDGTFAANAIKHGVAGLNIDGARIGTTVETWPASRSYGTKAKKFNTYTEQDAATQKTGDAPAGRWPKNVILSDDDCVKELFPETASGSRSGPNKSETSKDTTYSGGWDHVGGPCKGDSGSASRYFYTAKASRAERGGSKHPTVKPLTLIEYLCRLTMTPTGGVCLDPFLGSGTCAVACIRLGRPFIGIELDPAYFDDAVSRVKAALKEDREQPTLFDMKPERPTQEVLF